MWFSRCCDLPVCAACMATMLQQETADNFILWILWALLKPEFARVIKGAVKLSEHVGEVGFDLFASQLTRCFCLFTAPSTVSIMHQVSRTVDSITLSWSQPDQPNGVILDYELQYYEKVLTFIQASAHILSTKSLLIRIR